MSASLGEMNQTTTHQKIQPSCQEAKTTIVRFGFVLFFFKQALAGFIKEAVLWFTLSWSVLTCSQWYQNPLDQLWSKCTVRGTSTLPGPVDDDGCCLKAVTLPRQELQLGVGIKSSHVWLLSGFALFGQLAGLLDIGLCPTHSHFPGPLATWRLFSMLFSVGTWR